MNHEPKSCQNFGVFPRLKGPCHLIVKAYGPLKADVGVVDTAV